MKSMFDIGFRPQFMALPLRGPGLGDDDSPFITSIDQGPASTGDIPGLYTSVDQGPPSSGPIPGLVTQQDLQSKQPVTPSAASNTDWTKILADVVKSGATGYAGYTKAQIAEAAAKQKAGLPTGLPGVKVPPSSGISPNTIFIVGGIAAAAIIAVIAAA